MPQLDLFAFQAIDFFVMILFIVLLYILSIYGLPKVSETLKVRNKLKKASIKKDENMVPKVDDTIDWINFVIENLKKTKIN